MRIVGAIRGSNTSDRKVKFFTEALGGTIQPRTQRVEADLLVHWGIKDSTALLSAKEAEIPVIILDNPVWGERNTTFMWGYGGLNGMGWAPEPPYFAEIRPKLHPWKDEFEGVRIVFKQVPNDKALYGANIEKWARDCANVLDNYRPVFGFNQKTEIREHPVMLDSPQEPIEDALARCSLAVTYTSTVGPQAVIQGIPTVAYHPGSLAWPMASHHLSEPVQTPEREEWLNRLAWRHVYMDRPLDVKYVLSGLEYVGAYP